MRTITTAERRARIARRHGLAPGHRLPDAVAATDAMVALHGTDHSTVYLSAWARVDGLTRQDVDRALYADRTLVKQLTMRGTLFVVPRETLPAAVHGPGARVAAAEERLLVRDLERAGVAPDGVPWFREAASAVVDRLADGTELTLPQLRDAVPALGVTTPYEVRGHRVGGTAVGQRILAVLSARGVIVRGHNDGGWLVSRPRWTSMVRWLGGPLPEMEPDVAREHLVRRWLRAFGPGTEQDLRWWLGDTVPHVRAALRAVEAEEVALEGGGRGYVLPDDVGPEEPVEPWAALLPTLDATTMGWHERDWYLGPHRAELFDPGGNGGTTAWWDGRIVGAWHQFDGARVRVHLLEDVGRDGARALEREAERLTDWLDGARPGDRWPPPVLYGLRAKLRGGAAGA
ncbi:winged helix DNA-binding domain-containing protein [Georgenia daeguensis]|uniref:Winged helix DNA-binding domain-containing protein n=1 Tax=Georgenia daeguensis TaxID=908355 RepID=A0ABP8EWJ8_9MICO